MRVVSLLVLVGGWSFAAGLPVQYLVNQGSDECLFEKVDNGESFTISAFILGGYRLAGTITVDGPVAPATTESGMELLESLAKFEAGESFGAEPIKDSFETDFESLNIADEIAEEGEEEEQIEPPKEGETPEEQRARRAKERRKALEARQKEEKLKQTQKKKIRQVGKPVQKTYNVTSPGWYRYCVHAKTATITVELDLRKGSDYGGTNEESGHVFTLEEMEVDEDEKLMAKDTATEEGIKDEDFEAARSRLKTLRRLLADIQSKQTQERHRLMVHSATNEHSHSRMVLSSLLETVLFMLVTGFQVFTIRRWFKGAPQLGR